MDLATFLGRRRGEWRRLEELLGQVEGSGLASLGDEEAVELGRLYRRAALLFADGAVFGYLASRYDRETARAYLLPADMPTIKPPREGERDTTPLMGAGELSEFSAHLFTNNVSVSLTAFALGITF